MTDSASNQRFLPPLVSVIVQNYNYSQFLRDAVESVFAQTYPHVECIIVDDASTDDSPAVLDEIAAVYPATKIIRRKVNGNQLAVCLDGLAASTGNYVAFLDADDLLLEQSLATHAFVNLSLRSPVGFTCGDMVQLSGTRLVIGSTPSISDYVVKKSLRKAAVRPIAETHAGPWISAGLDRSVLNRLYSVDASCRSWPWSATSAFFFRRDALDLWMKTRGLAELCRSTDGFFAHAINATTGSVIIDEPVSALRIHGNNNFNKQAPLNNLRNYDPLKNGEAKQRLLILEEMTRDPERFPFAHPIYLKKALVAVDTADVTADAPAWARGSRLTRLLLLRCPTLAKIFGERGLARWMILRGVPPQAMTEAGIRLSLMDRLLAIVARPVNAIAAIFRPS